MFDTLGKVNKNQIINNKKLFLYTSEQFLDFINLKPFNFKNLNYLTQFDFDKNKLILNSFSLNHNDKIFDINHSNSTEKNDLTLLANDINRQIIPLKDILNQYHKRQLLPLI